MSSDVRRSRVCVAGESFDEVVVPHLDAAYRLARWLIRNEHDAEDAVQEAALLAFRYFRTFTGGSGRAWFMQIVRNTCYRWYARDAGALADPFDEEQHHTSHPTSDPEALLLQSDDVVLIGRAMRTLPARFRELLVLREMEGLSYRELANAMGLPMGTVMSGLSRARHALRGALRSELKRAAIPPTTRPREQEGKAALTATPSTSCRNADAAT